MRNPGWIYSGLSAAQGSAGGQQTRKCLLAGEKQKMTFFAFRALRNPGWIYSGLSYKSTLSQRVGPAEASALPDSFGCPIL
jgi:hypothetical protein